MEITNSSGITAAQQVFGNFKIEANALSTEDRVKIACYALEEVKPLARYLSGTPLAEFLNGDQPESIGIGRRTTELPNSNINIWVLSEGSTITEKDHCVHIDRIHYDWTNGLEGQQMGDEFIKYNGTVVHEQHLFLTKAGHLLVWDVTSEVVGRFEMDKPTRRQHLATRSMRFKLLEEECDMHKLLDNPYGGQRLGALFLALYRTTSVAVERRKKQLKDFEDVQDILHQAHQKLQFPDAYSIMAVYPPQQMEFYEAGEQ